MPILLATWVLLTQVVFVGPKKPDIEQFCSQEKVLPNLTLDRLTTLHGRVTDDYSAPLMRSRVELRRYVSKKKQTPVSTAQTDSDGRFELKDVAAGNYRLRASPTRAFRQPGRLSCENAPTCELTIRLKVNVTDLPESVCPIR